jgi:hypothetical protein
MRVSTMESPPTSGFEAQKPGKLGLGQALGGLQTRHCKAYKANAAMVVLGTYVRKFLQKH